MMEGLPSPDTQPLTTDGDSLDIEPLSSMQADEREYQEISMAARVSTEAVEADDGLVDNERAVSAGTANGTEYNFDAFSDDEGKMAELAVQPTTEFMQTTDAGQSGVEAKLLTRPAMSDGVHVGDSFSFPKAKRQQIYVTPTRQASASNMMPTPRLTGNHAEHDDSQQGLDGEGINGAVTPEPFHSADPVATSSVPQHEHVPAPLHAVAGEKKRNKKNSKGQGPPESIDRDLVGMAAEQEISRNADSSPDRKGHFHPHTDPHHPEVIDLDQVEDLPEHATTQVDVQEREGSPHVQLQGHLDAALQPQEHAVESASVTATQDFQVEQIELQNAQHPVDYEVNAQRSHGQGLEHAATGNAMDRVSDQPVPSRVQKRKPRSPRRAANDSQGQPAAAGAWRLSDYARLIVLKAEEQEHTREAQHTSEIETLEREVHQTAEARAAVQSQLDSVLEEKHELNAKLEQQKSKTASYASKFKTFKGFIDGLGNDINSIRRNANALRRTSDEVVHETESQRRRNLAACEEAQEQVKNFKKTMDEALQLARDKDTELHQIQLHRDQLHRELNNTVGVLSEERDRRVKLESQLQESEKKLLQTMKSNHNSVLDKLYLIHAAVEDEQTKNDTAEMIDQLRSVAKTIGHPSDSAIKDIATVKSLIEALDQRVNSTVEAAEAAGVSTRTHFDEALKAVQLQLADREKLIENHRDVVNGLQEQLNVCNGRLGNEEAQKSAAHADISELKEQCAALQTKISSLQSKISPAENAQVELNETKVELEKTISALGSAKADLENKTEEARVLTAANSSLGDQVKALDSRLHDLQRENDNPELTREELERKVQEAEQRTRKEMAGHIESFETELKTKACNELKKLTSEKTRLEKQLKPLQEELDSCKRRMHQMQTDSPPASKELKHELEKMKKHSQAQKSEIEALQSSLKDLRKSSIDHKALQEKLSVTSAQFNAEKCKLKEANERNLELQQQIKRLECSQEEMELAKEQAQDELANLRKKTDSQIESLRRELQEAKDDAEQSAAGLERLNESCNETLDNAKKQNEDKLQALHDQLSLTKADLETARREHEDFQVELETTWRKEQHDSEAKLAESSKKIVEAEARMAEAQANNDHRLQELQTTMDNQRAILQEQNEQLRSRLQAAEEKLQSQRRPSSNHSNTPSGLHVPSTKDRITPNVNARSMPPSKPRKIIDRNKAEVTDVDPIQVREEIRPDSRKTNSANGPRTCKGPIVEESQFISDPFAIRRGSQLTAAPSQGSFSGNSEEDIVGLQESPSQPLPQNIPETQFEDSLPSFAAISNRLNSTHGQPSLHSSTSASVFAPSGTNSGTKGIQPKTDSSQIYNIGQPGDQPVHSPRNHDSTSRRQSQSFSEEELKKYTFQKFVPMPNSASKRVRSNEHSSNHVELHQSEQKSKNSRYTTPNLDTSVHEETGNVRPPSALSSSPDFVQRSSGRRQMTTYHTSGGKSRLLQSNAGSIKDPRLEGRDQQVGTKRKAEGDIVEGYEHERKKRLGMAANNVGKDDRRAMPQQPQSINDLPRMKGEPTGSETRMRNFSGGISRTTRPSEKTPKSAEFGERFARELRRR